MRQTSRVFSTVVLLLPLLAASLLAATACEDEGTDIEKANCGDWIWSLNKYFDGDELVSCGGSYTPSCYLSDGTLVNDPNLDAEISWDYSLGGDLYLLSVEWSFYETTNTAVFEANVIDGTCGEGTIAFILSDGGDLDGCAAVEVTQTDWDNAGEVYN